MPKKTVQVGGSLGFETQPQVSYRFVMEQDAFKEGYCVCSCWATGGSGTGVRGARSWLEGDGPVPGPVPAAAGFGTKLIANKKNKRTALQIFTIIN